MCNQFEGLILILYRVQLAGAIDVEAIEGEERRVSEESTCTLFAGAIDDGRIGVLDRQRDILDNANTDSVQPDERELIQ